MNKDVNLRNKLVLVQSKYLSFQPNSQLIDCSFVHVFVVATEMERQDLHMGLSSVMMKLSKECQKDVLVYGVLTSVSTHVQSFKLLYTFHRNLSIMDGARSQLNSALSVLSHSLLLLC